MKNIKVNFNNLKKGILFLSVLSISVSGNLFAVDSEELCWRKLIPNKHYNYDEFNQVLNNSSVNRSEMVKVGAVYFQFFVSKNILDYDIPLKNNDSERIVISAVYLSTENKVMVLDTFCVDTTIKNFQNFIIISGMKFVLPVYNNEGQDAFLIWELKDSALFRISSSNGSHFSTDAVDSYTEPFGTRSLRLFYWDENTKKVWCYSSENDTFTDLNVKLKKPVFFTDQEKTNLLLCDEKTMKTKTGKLWQCEKTKLVEIQ